MKTIPLLKRITQDALTVKDGVSYFEDRPFTGVAYYIKDGRVEAILNYSNGKEVGNHKHPYHHTTPNTRIVTEGNPDLDEVDDTYNQYLPRKAKGKNFNGIIIEVVNHTVISELEYQDGQVGLEVTWHANGQLAIYDNLEQTHGVRFAFNERGQSLGYTIRTSKDNMVGVSFDDTRSVTDLQIEGDIFAALPAASITVSFAYAKTLDEVAKQHSGPKLNLKGTGITSKAISLLHSHEFFSTTSSLSLQNTNIDKEALDTLLTLPQLREMIVHDRHGQHSEQLVKAKNQHPSLHVRYSFLLI